MNFIDFKEWLENNTNGYGIFIRKANDLQEEKNKKRTGKNKKWNEARIEKEVKSMWTILAQNAYDKIRAEKGVPSYNGKQIWIDFMNEINFIEMFDDSVSDMEFE